MAGLTQIYTDQIHTDQIHTDQRLGQELSLGSKPAPALAPALAPAPSPSSGPRRALAIALLLSSLASTSLTGCSSDEVSARQAETATEESAIALSPTLPPEIPPAPAPVPADTTLARAATTAAAASDNTSDNTSDLRSRSPEGDHQGPFRVGNQTQHPIRIALQTRFDPETQKAINPDGLDLEPIHWDFAPGEGGQSGLLMSVPQGDVELSSGDVLVAFAQDGSRRYWGPYIVGETQLPFWDEARSEWQLLIQP